MRENDKRPTPETDAAIIMGGLYDEDGDETDSDLVHADVARTLERQRDEARERLEGYWIRMDRMVRIALRYRRERAATLGAADALIARCNAACARADRAEAIVAETLRVLPVGNIPSHTADSIPCRVSDLAREVGEQCARADRAEAELASKTALLEGVEADARMHGNAERMLENRLEIAECALAKTREELDWQNMPNRREPVRGGYEFYVNEEWTGIRDAALGEDAGFSATLMKTRYDPDDERVRVRRVLDDDALLNDLATEREARAEMDAALNIAEDMRREMDEAREQLAAAKREAETLATSIHRSEYSGEAPNWGLCDSVAGVISQIDNMYAGVRAKRDEAMEKLAETKDCGQDGSCVLSPGCLRHWEERCRELVRERDGTRDDRDVLAAQVKAMAETLERAQSEASRQSDRADRAEAELADLRSLWACDEVERACSTEAWREATGCATGQPSLGAMLRFFRRALATEREARSQAEQAARLAIDAARIAQGKSLCARIVAWQRETFPHATPKSCMAHFARECGELDDAVLYGDIDDTAEEAADCLLLLVALADRSGFDLLQAAEAKLSKNKLRKWGKPDEEGVVEHIEEGKQAEQAARIALDAARIAQGAQNEGAVDDEDSIPDTPMLVTCSSDHGDVTGLVMGKEI